MTPETKRLIAAAFEAAQKNEDLPQAAILCSLLATDTDPIGERDLLESTMAATNRSIARLRGVISEITAQSN